MSRKSLQKEFIPIFSTESIKCLNFLRIRGRSSVNLLLICFTN